jgi:enoyl-CoA hydratase
MSSSTETTESDPRLVGLTTIRIERSPDRRVVEVVLDSGKGNPLGTAFWDELPGVFPALADDPDARAILLRGEGRHFSTGLDLVDAKNLLAPAGGNAAERARFLRWVRQVQGAMTAIETCPKPVVAAIQGACIGGGVDIAVCADIRLASAQAVFSVREVRVAVLADGGSLQRLPTLLGEAVARRLLLTGEDFDAERARYYGLVSDVYPDPETLLAEARAMCRHLAGLSPVILQATKEGLNRCRDLTHEQGLEYVAAWNAALLANDDLQEAISAFAERRAPEFREW